MHIRNELYLLKQKIRHAHTDQRKADVVILILGKGIQEQRLSQVLKTITILIKGSNQQEIIILSIYVTNNIFKIQRKIGRTVRWNRWIVGDLSILFLIIDVITISRQKVGKDIKDLDKTMNHLIYGPFYPTAVEYMFFKSIHAVFFILGYKTSLNKFRIQVLQRIFLTAKELN